MIVFIVGPPLRLPDEYEYGMAIVILSCCSQLICDFHTSPKCFALVATWLQKWWSSICEYPPKGLIW